MTRRDASRIILRLAAAIAILFAALLWFVGPHGLYVRFFMVRQPGATWLAVAIVTPVTILGTYVGLRLLEAAWRLARRHP